MKKFVPRRRYVANSKQDIRLVLNRPLFQHNAYPLMMADSTTERQPPGTTPVAPKVSAPHSHSHFGTLFSRHLPEYSGSYPVGALDVEYPIEQQRIGSFRHRKSRKKGRREEEDAQAGIQIDTVLFTLFYPCRVEDGSSKGTVWFPRYVQ